MGTPWKTSVTGVFTPRGMDTIKIKSIKAIFAELDVWGEPDPLIDVIEELLARGPTYTIKAALLAQELQRKYPNCHLEEYLGEDLADVLLNVKIH